MQRDFGSRNYSGAICMVYIVCTVSLLRRKNYVLTRSGCNAVHNRATVQGVLYAAKARNVERLIWNQSTAALLVSRNMMFFHKFT
jgi:hypothetical protein